MRLTGEKVKSIIVAAFALGFVLMLLIFPSQASNGAFRGLTISAQIVIPSLFPVSAMVLFLFSVVGANPVRRSTVIFRAITGIDFSGFQVFLASCIGGYPVGASLLKKGYEDGVFTKPQAQSLLYCCVNAGPAFLILAVGNGVLGSVRIGRMLFIANFLASFLLLQLCRFQKTNVALPQAKENDAGEITEMFVDAVYRATMSVLGICAYVVLFSCFSSVLSTFPDKFGIINHLLLFTEVTGGVVGSGGNVFLVAFLTGFSGICVHFQVISNAAAFHPKLFRFFLSRILHGLLNTVLMKLMLILDGTAAATITNGIEYSGKAFFVSAAEGISLVLLAVALLLSLVRKIKSGNMQRNMI